MNHDFSIKSSRDVKGRIVANMSFLGVARIIAAVLGVCTLIITARTLGNTATFGTLLFIHAYMLFFSKLATFKVWQAIIRFGSIDVKENNPNRFGTLIHTGIKLDAASAVIAFILAISLFEIYLGLSESLQLPSLKMDESSIDIGSLKKLLYSYCVLIIFRQLNVAIGVFRLFDQFVILAVRAIVMPALRLGGALITYLQGWGLVEFLWIWFIASLVSYLVMQIFAIRELHKRNLLSYVFKAKFAKPTEISGFFPYVIKTNINSTLAAFEGYFPSILLMAIFGPASLAVYRIAEEIARLLSRAISLFDQVLFPELSRLVVEKNLRPLAIITMKAAMGVGIIGFVISAFVLIFGESLIQKSFEDGFEAVPLLAVMLLIATSLKGVAVPFYSVFYVLMIPGRAIWVRIAAIAFYFAVFSLLIQSFELFAIAWAAIASSAFEVSLVIIFATMHLRRKETEAIVKD